MSAGGARVQAAKRIMHVANARAAAQMEAIRSADSLERGDFERQVRMFVLEKFHLAGRKLPSDDFDELVELSLARSMSISPELVAEFDNARDCESASSALSKKVLLFMALQRELSIELPAYESAHLATLQDLCELCWQAVCARMVDGVPPWRR